MVPESECRMPTLMVSWARAALALPKVAVSATIVLSTVRRVKDTALIPSLILCTSLRVPEEMLQLPGQPGFPSGPPSTGSLRLHRRSQAAAVMLRQALRKNSAHVTEVEALASAVAVQIRRR